ncbi:MAG TPA: glycosyltransferase, partial [Pseudolabrys sp.]|nr:glycosyltransferase [Pseudolabrys sp.]
QVNSATALRLLGRDTDAAGAYARALAIDPSRVEIWITLGNTFDRLQRHDDALRCWDHALTLKPDCAEAHWNKGLEQLLLGDFEQGFAEYEWRWKRAGNAPRDFGVPQWRGEDVSGTSLAGKTILLHAEQGFGDTIQFVRYLPTLAARGAKIVLEVPDSLMPLIGDIDGVIAMISRGQPHPPIDLHCPLMSLPLAFGTTLATIPATVPYLRAPAERVEAWRARLPASGKLRVGLVWSGKPTHRNDHNRSIAFAQLAPVLAVPNIDFVSLQRDVRETDAPALQNAAAVLRPDLDQADFADTAAIIETLDLVIAVDTAVAHLTGALAKPLWLLLPLCPDWRWLLDRTDSSWYPGARLFRQPRIGDWDSVIGRVAEGLASFAATRDTPVTYL